jgi:hypothetical protein
LIGQELLSPPMQKFQPSLQPDVSKDTKSTAKATIMPIINLYPASEATCLQMLRSILRGNQALVDQFYKEQGAEYFKLRDRFPTASKAKLVKAAQYHVAHRLYAALHNKDKKTVPDQQNQTDPVDVLAMEFATIRKKPKEEWLLDHKKFILDLNAKEVSTRGISKAIEFRFRKKISHTKIAQFLKVKKAKE